MALAQKKKTATKASAKPAAKKATKTAAKNAYSAATRSRSATSGASSASWAKDTAKLYQLPFATGDMEAAGKQAAAKIQNTAESMMKMGAEAMQQFWNQAQSAAKNPEKAFSQLAQFSQAQGKAGDVFGYAMPAIPGFDAAGFKPQEAFKKFEHIAREAAESLNKATSGAGSAAHEASEVVRDNAEAVVEVCNIAMSLLKEMGAEAISFANKSFSQNVEISKEALTCRTLNDMFDLAGRITKANLDSFFSQSVKMSEMLFQCATEVSEPLNDRVSESAERLSKAMAA